MTETTGGRRSGGRAARQAARAISNAVSVPYITRALKPFEVLSEEHLSLIEENADTVLEQVGIEFRDTPEALQLFKDAGADIDGERVRFPRGLARSIVQASAPATFTQVARNPVHTVEIGGPNTVLAPAYGSPFVRDLDNGRRYGTIEDFRNFVKLTYMTPFLHHSGGTVCEPVDVPVNKRHYDMVYAHMRYSDKAFMGSVTHPSRAEDTVAMAQDPVRRRLPRDEHRDRLARQRQLADGVGLDDARCGEGVCGGQPGRPDHAVHPRRRDEPGHRRRHRDADARRGARRDGVLPARAARARR